MTLAAETRHEGTREVRRPSDDARRTGSQAQPQRSGQARHSADSTRALRAVPLLRELGSRHLQAIAEMGQLRRYASDAMIFEEGESGETLHVIIEGVTRVVRISAAGGEVLLGRLGPGEVLGELALIDGGVRSATAITEDPSAHVVIERVPFQQWLQNEPTAAMALLRTLVTRLRETDEALYSVTLRPLIERVATLLMEEGGEDGTIRLTQHAIAGRLGVTREAVNKNLRRLEASGIIEINRGRCTILDRSALEQATII